MSYLKTITQASITSQGIQKKQTEKISNFFGSKFFQQFFFSKTKLTRFVEKMNLYYQLHD